MATAIGDLVVNLRTNSRGFKRGMGQAGQTLRRFAGSVAALVGAGSMGLLIKNSLQTIDATAKLSDRIGVSTEFISAMGFAAEQTGASHDVLTKAIQDFSKRIGQAEQGLSTQKRALDLLGLSAEQVSQIPLEDAFSLVADRMQGLESQTMRTAVATDLFGRSGVQLINLLSQGSAGIAAFREEAARLGVSFSRVDAAKIEQANDAMNRMKRAVGGVANELTIMLAPAIENIATTMTEFVLPKFKGFPSLIDEVGFAFANFGTSAQIALLDIVSQGLKAFPELHKPIEQVAAFFVGTWSGVEAFFASIIDNIIGGFKELKNVAVAIGKGIAAAFETIASGDAFKGADVGKSFGDAFVKELANQADVEAPNAFKEFGEAFESAQKKTLDKFKGAGGIASFVEKESDRLKRSLGERADAFSAVRDAEKKAKSKEATKPAMEKSQERKLLEGRTKGSKAAFDSILSASNQSKKPEEQTAKHTADTAKSVGQAVAELKGIKGQLDSSGGFVVGSIR